MKKLLFLIAIITAFTGLAQDTVTVKHHAYTTVFINSAKIPALVTYTLHKSQITCPGAKIARTNNFKADPLIPGTSLSRDYNKSGYDQGHNMSAQDNSCDGSDMAECFYYSNMFPQTPKLNRGVWKSLEVQERAWAVEYDSIVVFIGSYGLDHKLSPDSVFVPKYNWKVIYIPVIKALYGYDFPNNSLPWPFGTDGKPNPEDYKFSGLPVGLEEWAHYVITRYTDFSY